MVERYIGIENELISFRNGQWVGFNGNMFERLIDPSDYLISSHAIRTITGHGFYIDMSEIEILTPPVALNKGFATRLTDLLMMGRDKVIDSQPKYEHTGYSMHWNITCTGNVHSADFYNGLKIPFHLFGLTPLSIGLGMRHKDKGARYEILGDSITNEDQIRATALLLGSYAFASECEGETLPLRADKLMFNKDGNRDTLLFPDGRYDYVDVIIKDLHKTIQVQNYLEIFYSWISPFVKALGTPDEIKNLEDFIEGRKKLEFDKFKYYAYLNMNDAKDDGIYHPIKTSLTADSPVLKSSNSARDLPLEGRLLGNIVATKGPSIIHMEWDELIIKPDIKLYGISEIYNFAEHLSGINFKGPSQLEDIKPNKITEVDTGRNRVRYSADNDNFVLPKDQELYLHYFFKEVKDNWKRYIIALLIVCYVSFFSSLGIQSSRNNHGIKTKVEHILSQYKEPEE